MEIYIVRHGETVWNKEKRLQGTADIELNEFGRALAIETGRNLANVTINKIFSSPLKRAYELESLIKDAGVVVYEGATHYAYLERLNQVVSVLYSFFDIKE